ncbi:MAG: hypothetical protein Q9184_006244 [Pyrenodesmia sp. 2 TL-2023]
MPPPPTPPSPTLSSKCNTLFLSLLSSLPGSTSTNPLSLDLDNSAQLPPTLSNQTPSLIITLKMPPGQGLLGKTMNWDDTADKNLLLELICDSDFKPNFPRTAAKFGITPSAASQRLGKLKKKAREGGFALGGGEAAAANDDTEAGTGIKAKTTKGKAAAAAAAGKKGKAAEMTDDNDVSSGGDAKPAPAKKRARKANNNEGDTPAAKKAKGANGAAAVKGKKGKNAVKNETASLPLKEERAVSSPAADSEATTVKEEGADEEREIKHYRFEDATSENEEVVEEEDGGMDGTQEV